MRKPVLILVGALVVALLATLLHIGIGTHFWYRPWDVLAEVLRGPMTDPTTENVVVWANRLPRALQGLLVGMTLGIVGSAFQAQLRNPLADPYIVGVSSGAAIGGVIAILIGFDAWLAGTGMIAVGTLTGLASLALVYWLATRRGIVDVTALLLSGVAVGALLSALTSLALLGAGQDTNRVLQFLLGSLTSATWPQNAVLAVCTFAGSALLIIQARKLNAFALGEDTAGRLGVDVPRLRTIVLIAGTTMVAAAVSCVGIIGFLGLVAPHIARKVLGVDWRYSLPASAFIGGAILVLADIVAQRGMSALTSTVGMEMPVGLVTAIIGAPSLLILLRKA